MNIRMVSQMKSETTIQNEIRVALSRYGLVVRQNVGNFYTEYGGRVQCGFKGLSDLVFFSNDGKKVAFIETKTPMGRLSKEQKAFLERMKSYGYIAGVARSVEEALQLIGEE